MMRMIWILICVGGGLSCSGNRSLNRMWVSSQDKVRFDVLLVEGQAFYDRQQYDSAVDSAQAAYALNPNSEGATQLLAYSKLGQVGLSIISVTQLLINVGTQGNISELLVELNQLLNITDQDLIDMSTKEDVSTNPYFIGLNLYFPKNPGDYNNAADPRSKVGLLRTINEVIAILCPFVPSDLRGSEARYTCANAKGAEVHGSQTLLLYGLAHLAEAVAFNALLFYSSTPATASSSDPLASSNLLLRIAQFTQIQSVTLSNVTEVVGASSEMAAAYAAILAPSAGSMESELIVDFNEVAMSFAAIPGMPASVVTGINSTLASLKSIKQLGGPNTTLASAYQQQIMAKFSSELNTAGATITKQIARLSSEQTQQNIQVVCTALQGILGTSVTLPTECSG